MPVGINETVLAYLGKLEAMPNVRQRFTLPNFALDHAP
jgi:hypothetical protein